MVLFTCRWAPYYRYVGTLIDEGYLGRCFHCYIDTDGTGGVAQYAGGRLESQHWRPGDLGSHMIDLARWYVGDIARVSAHLGVYGDRLGPEGRPLIRPTTRRCCCSSSRTARRARSSPHDGAHGGSRPRAAGLSCAARRHSQSRLCVRRPGGRRGCPRRAPGRQPVRRFPCRTTPGTTRSGSVFFSALIPGVFLKRPAGDRLFIDAILEGRQVSPSFADGLKAQEVMDAAIRSHEQGVWVSLDNP